MSGFVLLKNFQQIPEWRQCYYDWDYVRQIILFIKKVQQIQQTINLKRLINTYRVKIQNTVQIRRNPNLYLDMEVTVNNLTQNSQSQNKQELDPQQVEIFKQINQILVACKTIFVKFTYNEHKLTYCFAQFKTFQIDQKFKQYSQMLKKVKHIRQQRNKITILYQNLYIQSYYLQNALVFNNMHQQYLLKHLQHTLFDNQLKYLLKHSHKSKRLIVQNYKKVQRIQLESVKYNHQRQQSSYQDLKQMSRDIFQINYNEMLLIGFFMGCVAFMAGLVIYNRSNIARYAAKSEIFYQRFRVWRGGSYFLLYMWVLGFVIILFEKAKINYTLIFHYQAHDLPRSKFMLMRASIFTLIYFILFMAFCYQLSNENTNGFYYQGQCFWALIILYFLFPIDILEKYNRLNFGMLLLKILASPFVQVTFMMVWITEQFASHTQPFGDFVYTLCFTISRQRKSCVLLSKYFNNCFITLVLVYRIIQCTKLVYGTYKITRKFNFMDGNLLAAIACFLSIVSIYLAIIDSYQIFQGSFTLWIVAASIITIFCWFADVKGDWGLLQFENRKCLKKKLLFPSAQLLYLFLMIINMLLRAAWILSISPVISQSERIQAELFVLMFQYLQIIRRGVWNFLTVQQIHLANCQDYQATIKNTETINKIKKTIKKQEQKKKQIQCLNMIDLGLNQQVSKSEQGTQTNYSSYQPGQIQQKRSKEQRKLLQYRLEQRERLRHQVQVTKSYLNRKIWKLENIVKLKYGEPKINI